MSQSARSSRISASRSVAMIRTWLFTADTASAEFVTYNGPTLVRHVVRHGDTPSGHGVTLAVLILRAWGGVFRCIFAVVIPSDLSGGGRGERATLAVRLGCPESGAELEAYWDRPTPARGFQQLWMVLVTEPRKALTSNGRIRMNSETAQH